MLITYADSLGKNLKELRELLDTEFREIVGGVHILPFYPSSADRGFAPMTYEQVDPAFGDWDDLESIAKQHTVMVDFMINHISRSSTYYHDFQQHKEASPYRDFFLRYRDFWPDGEPTNEDVDRIYKRKPRAPYVEIEFADKTVEKIWCTFDEEQIDLNVAAPVTKSWIADQLTKLMDHGAKAIRLDAFAYATKKIGTNCFFVEPDTWALLEEVSAITKPRDVVLLPEIHEHYSISRKLTQRGYYVYDFALPMLVLHALFSGSGAKLANWLRVAPQKQFTTLDTHDGIGIVDVVDLLSEEEIEMTKENLYAKGANVKRIYSSTAYQNLDIYQVNCTYYSALGDHDQSYLLARAIQFFAPGIPQVYYVGLLAGRNDIELLEKTKVGRDINRHYYSKDEVLQEIQRPVVQRLFALMKFRNQYPAFLGDIEVTTTEEDHILIITRTHCAHKAILTADLVTYHFMVEYVQGDKILTL